jgi:hypothetical protein
MINIFTRPSYIGNLYPQDTNESSVLRISSRIRGEEIANHLGAKLNPARRYKKDICIFVKPKSLASVHDGDYLDYLDGKNMWLILKDHPKIKVIAASKPSFDFLKENLTNEIFLIPPHHLNWERNKRKRKKISIGGYIGSPSPQAFKMYDNIKTNLKRIGFDMKTCFNFQTRQDAINLHKSIDLFIIGDWTKDDSHTKIPTKIINAASFGLPTIAYPLKGYQEVEGNYVHAHNIEEMLVEVEKFKDDNYYNVWSDKVAKMAEEYHIDRIAQLYKALT